jgi:uncharacterized damage-inducible protein DinB
MPEENNAISWMFRHNTWANLKLLDFCAGLSDEQLDASAAGGYGSIRETLVHIVVGEVDDINLATEKLPDLLITDSFPGFETLKAAVRWAGEEWLKLAAVVEAEPIVRVTRPDEPIYEYPLAGLMVAAINHATEHRTQIATIITQLGLEPPVLSGFKYMRETGVFHEMPAGEGEG